MSSRISSAVAAFKDSSNAMAVACLIVALVAISAMNLVAATSVPLSSISYI